MFLKRERPETDYFAIKKISGCEGELLCRNFNILRNNAKFLAIFSVSRHPYKIF